MSRVQLALNVSDLDEAVDFYSKLFATEPAKLRPGYANFAIAEPPLKLVLIEGDGEPGTLNHLGVEVESTDEVAAATAAPHRRRARHRDRGRGLVLLRRAGQGLGRRPRRRAVGDLHRARRRRDARRRAPRRATRPPTRCAAAPRRNRLPAAAERMTPPGLARRAHRRGASAPAFLVAIVVGSGIAAQRLSPERRRPPAAGELARHRRRSRCADPGVRAAVRRALQPRGHPRRSFAGRDGQRRGRRLRRRPAHRRVRRGDRRQPHVRAPRHRVVHRTNGRPAGCGSARSWRPSGSCW